MTIDAIPDSVVVAPPAGMVTAQLLFGIPVDTWVLWLNLIYIVLAILWKVTGIDKRSKDDS